MSQHVSEVLSDLTLPDYQETPPGRFQGDRVGTIPLDVSIELLRPPLGPSLRDDRIRASVPVPEASSNLNSGPTPREHNVGATRELPVVQTKAVAHCEQAAPYEELRLRVLCFDGGEVPAPCIGNVSEVWSGRSRS